MHSAWKLEVMQGAFAPASALAMTAPASRTFRIPDPGSRIPADGSAHDSSSSSALRIASTASASEPA